MIYFKRMLMEFFSENGEEDMKLIQTWQQKDSTFIFKLTRKLVSLLEEII
jgi:hypothetical protein